MKRLLSIAVAVALAATGTVAAAGAASAAPANCPANAWCIYENNSYGGGYYYLSSYNMNFQYATWYNKGGVANDKVSSSYNNRATSDWAYFAKNANCGGDYFHHNPQSGDANYSNGSPAGGFNDTLSSGWFASKASYC